MDERSTRVSDLLHEAAETHHRVFRITDGADDDWASWYAQWLVGPIVAAIVLCAWSHPGRCRTDAAFAMLGGPRPSPPPQARRCGYDATAPGTASSTRPCTWSS
jgi:hypothetical protein